MLSDLLLLPFSIPLTIHPQFESRSKTKALFLYFDFLCKISNMQETPTQSQRSGLRTMSTVVGGVAGQGVGVDGKALMPADLSPWECHQGTWAWLL